MLIQIYHRERFLLQSYVVVVVMHYRIYWLCRVPVTLGKGQFALGKLFAECYTRQSLPRQRDLCRVSDFGYSVKTLPRAFAKFENFAECRRLALGKVPAQGGATWPLCRVLDPGTRQMFETLPSAKVLALGKAATCCPVDGHIAECIGLSTRQSGLFFFFFASFSSVFRYKYNKYIYKCKGHYRQL